MFTKVYFHSDTAIISFINNGKDLLHVGTFNANTKNLTIQNAAVFWNGSTVVPLDSPLGKYLYNINNFGLYAKTISSAGIFRFR